MRTRARALTRDRCARALVPLALYASSLALCRIRDTRCAVYTPPRDCIQIRLFTLPGWNATGSYPDDAYPAYSRVNHAKYAVTNKRAHVATSNFAWGYFYQTAGASLNTDDEALRTQVAAVFERNWDSAYASPLV